jgi:NTP pyrophosphatase (non-canonical NTP hydrolase)
VERLFRGASSVARAKRKEGKKSSGTDTVAYTHSDHAHSWRPAYRMSTDLQQLQAELRKFAKDRDWDQFHSPKNLAAALSVEAAELLEHFQWLTEEQSKALSQDRLDQVGEEIADVLLYLVRLSDKLGIDPMEAAKHKLIRNAEKYPIDRAKGSIKKYTEL